jgi:hypothetical protein
LKRKGLGIRAKVFLEIGAIIAVCLVGISIANSQLLESVYIWNVERSLAAMAQNAEHAENAAFNVNKAWVQFFNNSAPELLLMAIKSHMGQWSTCKDDRPFTTLDRVVHLADYMASRKFIDIPTLSAEGGEKEEENA